MKSGEQDYAECITRINCKIAWPMKIKPRLLLVLVESLACFTWPFSLGRPPFLVLFYLHTNWYCFVMISNVHMCKLWNRASQLAIKCHDLPTLPSKWCGILPLCVASDMGQWHEIVRLNGFHRIHKFIVHSYVLDRHNHILWTYCFARKRHIRAGNRFKKLENVEIYKKNQMQLQPS